MNPDIPIIRRYCTPNLINQRGLNERGLSWEEAAEYDELDRRVNMLLDLGAERHLSGDEDMELCAASGRLMDLERKMTRRQYAERVIVGGEPKLAA